MLGTDEEKGRAGSPLGGGPQKAGLLSRLLWIWVNPLVGHASKKPLTEDLLFDLNRSNNAKPLLECFDAEWDKNREEARQKGKDPSLSWTLYYVFFWSWIMTGLGWLVNMTLQLAFPFLIRAILLWYEDDDSPQYVGYVLVVILFSVQFCQSALIMSHVVLKLYVLGMDYRTLCNALVYRKAMALSAKSRMKFSTGQITTLMSADSENFPRMTLFVHTLWVNPLFIVVAVYLLILLIGPSALVGVGLLLLAVPIQMKLGFMQMKISREKLRSTDDRVHLVSEVLESIKILKFYVWEASFQDRVEMLRKIEIEKVLSFAYVNATNIALTMTLPLVMILLTLVTYYETGGDLKPDIVFTAISLLYLIRFPIIAIPMALASYVQGRASMKRLERFLLEDEIEMKGINWVDESGTKKEGGQVTIQNGTFRWPENAEPGLGEQPTTELKECKGEEGRKFTLRNIRLGADAGKLVGVVGGVGSGKSSFLNAILGEMPCVDPLNTPCQNEKAPGKPQAIGNPSVHSLPHGNYTRNSSVVSLGNGSTAEILPNKEQIELKEAPAKINSKGHSQTIVHIRGSLAYCAQEAWIQNGTVKDNIIFYSAYDESRYKRVIKACALAMDIKQLPAGELTEIGEKGVNLSGGQKQRIALARAVYQNADIYLLDDILSAVDAHVGKHIFEEVICGLLKDKKVILATNSLQFVSKCDTIIVLSDGSVTEQGRYEELMDRSEGFSKLMKQFTTKSVEESKELEDDSARNSEGNEEKDTPDKAETKKDGDQKGALTTKETMETGALGWGTLHYFFVVCLGGALPITVTIIVATLAQASQNIFEWWLAVWTEAFLEEGGDPADYFVIVYAILGVVTSLLIYLRLGLFAKILAVSAENIHRNLLRCILDAPMMFFDTTPTGRIINRFSKDMDQIDTYLQRTIPQAISQALSVIGVILTIVVLVPVFLIAVVPILVCCFQIQRYFRPVSRGLQRLESVSRSPIFSGFGESLLGLATIRAFKIQSLLTSKTISLLDSSNRAFYLLHVCNRWLQLRLEALGAMLVGVIGILVVSGRSSHLISMNAGLAGLLLTYAQQITQSITWTLRMGVETEARMTSVERIREYSMLKPEKARENPDCKKMDSWPQQGAIELKDVSMRYRPGLPLVLKNVTLSIPAGFKIGICGRTGSGKSSLMTALFRLVEPEPGSRISIDGVDCLKLGLDDARSAMAIIPQDPVLFQQTIRYNLDPFGKYPDKELWSAIKAAELHTVVDKLPHKLEDMVEEGGKNFSLGQRQLICLARAVLRNPKVLIMDEATASIDYETDLLIQKTIRNCFKHSTVLTIAHRLETIMDSDRILVMDNGKVAEFESPKVLLDENSQFFLLKSLVKDSGIKSSTKVEQKE